MRVPRASGIHILWCLGHVLVVVCGESGVSELGAEGDVGDSKLWAGDESLDASWMQRADRRGNKQAALSMAKAKSISDSNSARIQHVEEAFARNDAQSAATLVDETRQQLRFAKRSKREADKKAAMAGINQDRAERHAVKNMVEVDVDEDAPDHKDFLTNARRDENFKRKIAATDEINAAKRSADQADRAADVAARRVQISKQEYSEAQQRKMVADGMLLNVHSDTDQADHHAQMAAAKLSALSKRVALAKKPQVARSPHDLILNDENKLVRVRYPRTDAKGKRTIYTMVGNKMLTLRLSEKEAAAMKSSTRFPDPDDDAARADRKVMKDVTSVRHQATLNVIEALGGKEQKKLRKRKGTHGEYELGGSLQLMNPKVKVFSDKAPGVEARLLRGPPSAIDKMLRNVNSIAASLNSRLHSAKSAAEDVTRDEFEDGIHHVTRLTDELKEGASHTLRLVEQTGNSSRATQSTTSAEQKQNEKIKAVQQRQHEELMKKIRKQDTELNSLREQLAAALGGKQKTSQSIADSWASENLRKWNTDARKFSAKLLVLKKSGKRKHLARLSTAAWLAQEKVVDGSADDLKTARETGKRRVKKFKESREIAADATKRMKLNKKKRLWAKQAFTGFGPKMSDERANASAQARQVAKARERAKAKYQAAKVRYTKSVAWRIKSLKAQREGADKMMKALQKELKEQRIHYENKLMSAKLKLKAEIGLRTSCKAVMLQIGDARHKCQCGTMASFTHDLRCKIAKVEVAALKSENYSLKRSIKLLKSAAPMQNSTNSTTGAVAAVGY